MIVPTKYTNFSQSLLGLGAYILSQLNVPKSVDELWRSYSKDYKNQVYFAKHSFDNLIMALMFLYNVGSIAEKDGMIEKCT